MMMLVCDTSNSTCCAGVFEDGKRLSGKLNMEPRTHSETFMPLVHEMMAEARITHDKLDCYAAVTGPGSFTGIRIGLAAVKAMSAASGKPCVAVSSTEALERSCENVTATKPCETIMIPAFDARNNRVFAQVMEDDTAKSLIRENAYDADELALAVTGIPEIIYGARRQIIVVGSGSDAMKRAFERLGATLNIYYAPGAVILPEGVAKAAFAAVRTNKDSALVSGLDICASYCAASRVKTLDGRNYEGK